MNKAVILAGAVTITLVLSDDGFSWTQTPEICLEADQTSGLEDDLNRSCTVRKDGIDRQQLQRGGMGRYELGL